MSAHDKPALAVAHEAPSAAPDAHSEPRPSTDVPATSPSATSPPDVETNHLSVAGVDVAAPTPDTTATDAMAECTITTASPSLHTSVHADGGASDPPANGNQSASTAKEPQRPGDEVAPPNVVDDGGAVRADPGTTTGGDAAAASASQPPATVKSAAEATQKPRQKFYIPPFSRLFIGNMAPELIREQDLLDVFTPYGEVLEVSLKGNYAFVQFDNPDACARALAGERGKPIKGHRVDMEMCKKQPRGYYAALARHAAVPPQPPPPGPPGIHRRPYEDPMDHRRHPYPPPSHSRGPSGEYGQEEGGFRPYHSRRPAHGEARAGYAPRGYGNGYDRAPGRDRHYPPPVAYSPPPPPLPPLPRSQMPPMVHANIGERHAAYHPPSMRGSSPSRPSYEGWSAPAGARHEMRGGIRRPPSPTHSSSGASDYRRRSRSPPPARRSHYMHPGDHRRRSRSPVDRSPRRSLIDAGVDTYSPLAGRSPAGRLAACQIIVLDEIDRRFVSYIEQGLSRSNVVAVDTYYLPPDVSLRSVVRQMLSDGVRVVIFLERRHETSGRLSMQVFAESSQPHAQNVKSDEYEDITVEDAAAILRRDLEVRPGIQPSNHIGDVHSTRGNHLSWGHLPAAAPPPPPPAATANTTGASNTNTLVDLLATLQQQQQQQQQPPAPFAIGAPAPNTNSLAALLQAQLSPTATTAAAMTEHAGANTGLDVGQLLQILTPVAGSAPPPLGAGHATRRGDAAGHPPMPYGYPR
ncbi:hypothetical protein THASP1DRAFT_27218 [Thamnocephalis sphaerospora]|uniref:RRM domain-containing protein n=1 Tax=Thamnocephalis sphaerospora TaxID=78915 RepID=A0A4P9XZ21_9FUNG|nr:hypothetical protein THASP1DRAFT_27218 [Thamnocephalis sphaerospora]|eukprot:RKP10971.1 hypothetical protein THASP1DRAFT_27218 [Thamnocephalis sphaerospora]